MTTNKRRKTEAAPSTGPELPDEMMMEVLLRLPVKSILRYRAVCRAWAAALSSDEFCALHMARAEAAAAASARPNLLLVAPTSAACRATAVYSSSPPDQPGASLLFTLDELVGDFVDGIAAQCRGLILLHDAVAPAYYVVNAATRAVTRLPHCKDALYSSAGLGYDAQTGKYKVMRISREGRDATCEVYTLGGVHGDRWRPAAGRVPSSFSGTAQRAVCAAESSNLPPVFVNGSLHWLVVGRPEDKRLPAHIITFAVTEETFGWVQSPPCGTSLGVQLVELDDCLCMVRDLRGDDGSPDLDSAIEIWKLQDYTGGVWSLDTRIDLSHAGIYLRDPHTVRVLGDASRINYLEPNDIRVLGAIGDGRSTKKIILATSKHTVHAYDAMSKNVETILSAADTQVCYPGHRAAIRICLFKETLAPVHKTREERFFSSPLAKATKEILLRLPPRSTVQFKSVSAQWHRFIEDKSFVRSYHAHKSMEKRIKITIVGKGAVRRKAFHFAPLERWCSETANKATWLDSKVVCSKPCHGLNLLITAEMNYLYNPCTGYWRRNSYPGPLACVPRETPRDGCWNTQDHAFVIGNKNVGLGFNPLYQEHVAVIMHYEYQDFESRGYNLQCLAWYGSSGCVQNLLPTCPVNNMPPAYVDGAMYWMSDPMLGSITSNYGILCYDFAMGEFSVISCPPEIDTANWSIHRIWNSFVVELGGKLCVVRADLMADELVIWDLQNGKWNIIYTVHLKASPGYSLLSNVVVPQAVDSKDGRILLSTGRKMGLYDPVNETIEELFEADKILHTKKKAGARSQGAPCQEQAMPHVPMLYEESIVSYPRMRKDKIMH